MELVEEIVFQPQEKQVDLLPEVVALLVLALSLLVQDWKEQPRGISPEEAELQAKPPFLEIVPWIQLAYCELTPVGCIQSSTAP